MPSQFKPCDACRAVGETCWQLGDRHFCQECLAKCGLGDCNHATHPLIEELHVGFLKALMLSLWTGLVLTTLLAGMIVSFFLMINLFGLIALNPPPRNGWAGFARAIPLFSGFAFAFVGIFGFPMALIFGWTKRPRRLSIDDEAFKIETAFATTRLPFKDCIWSTPKIAFDVSGCYFPNQRLIVIQSIDAKNVTAVACGFTENDYQAWRAFLSLEGIPFKRPPRFISWLKWVGGGTAAGAAFGLLVGAAISEYVGQPVWIVSLGLMGFVDGGIWGIVRMFIKTAPFESLSRGDFAQGRKWSYFGIVFPLTGFVLGMKCGPRDLNPALALGTANAIVTALLGWDCANAHRNRLAATSETEGDLPS